ncbi:MAG: hypothetical protein ACE5JD_04225 [Candidatus Methylomirabilia bacterium]
MPLARVPGRLSDALVDRAHGMYRVGVLRLHSGFGRYAVGVVWDPANPAGVEAWRAMQAAAQVLGVELQSLEVRSHDDIESAFDAAISEQADALMGRCRLMRYQMHAQDVKRISRYRHTATNLLLRLRYPLLDRLFIRSVPLRTILREEGARGIGEPAAGGRQVARGL